MEMRNFLREDYQTYLAWFEDPDLNRELGPMDNQWLEYVLNESPPKEFCFFEDEQLVAVVGTEVPASKAETTWYVTSIAVNPTMKRQGIGKHALQLLIETHSLRENPPKTWIAWVDQSNSAARKFFKELAWKESVKPDNDDMFQFRLEVT